VAQGSQEALVKFLSQCIGCMIIAVDIPGGGNAHRRATSTVKTENFIFNDFMLIKE
jgi:hypothetical protein